MSVQFDWQTDGDGREEEPLPEGQPLSRRWRVFWMGVVGLLVVVGGLAGFWLVRESRARAAVFTQEVLASHQLLLETAAKEDADLFAALLSPYYGRWPETGRQLLAKNLFVDRSAFSLWAAPGWQEAPAAVDLTPDMQTAVVTTDIPFITEKQGGITETVTLRQTAVYERDGEQWWLTP
ncbi:MAG: nuclear transport factor 2 family protein, partial [Anaerolineae bacterium]